MVPGKTVSSFISDFGEKPQDRGGAGVPAAPHEFFPRPVPWLEVFDLLRQMEMCGAMAAQSIPWACSSPFPRKSRWKSESLVQPIHTPPCSSAGSEKSSKYPQVEARQQAWLKHHGPSSSDLLYRGLARRELLTALLHAAAGVDAEEEGHEDNGYAQPAHDSDSVPVDEAGEEDGKGLAESHDDGEDGCPELVDGVKDEELAAGRAHREQHGVGCELRVAGHEAYRLQQGTLLQERAHREKAGEDVDTKHHLHRRHLVGEEGVLPVGGEAVKDDVASQEDYA